MRGNMIVSKFKKLQENYIIHQIFVSLQDENLKKV